MKALLVSLLIPLLGSNLFNNREIGSFLLQTINGLFDCRKEISDKYYCSDDLEIRRRLKKAYNNYGENLLPLNHGLLLRHFYIPEFSIDNYNKNINNPNYLKYFNIIEEAFKSKIKYIEKYDDIRGWHTILDSDYSLWFYYGDNDFLLGDIPVNLYLKEKIKQGKTIQWCQREIKSAYVRKYLFNKPNIIIPTTLPIPFYLSLEIFYEVDFDKTEYSYDFPIPMNGK